MSDRINDQLFPRGTTWYNGGTIDANNLQGANILGQEKAFEDVDYSQYGIKPVRTNQLVYVRAVRNLSGQTLYAKELVQLAADGQSITGRAVNDSQHAYPIDEFVPATGVPTNDICYVVVEGPAMMITAFTGAEFNGDITAGNRLHSVTTTAGSTQAGTTSEGGRVANFTTVAATTVAQFNSLIAFTANWVGTAISAKTTANTNANILVDVRRRF
jgi:hypothetical protein